MNFSDTGLKMQGPKFLKLGQIDYLVIVQCRLTPQNDHKTIYYHCFQVCTTQTTESAPIIPKTHISRTVDLRKSVVPQNDHKIRFTKYVLRYMYLSDNRKYPINGKKEPKFSKLGQNWSKNHISRISLVIESRLINPSK